MAISYDLSIVQTLLFPQDSYPGGDYLGGVLWQMTGTDGTNSSSKQGLVRFDVLAKTDAYVPFSELSRDTIIAWTEEAIGPDTFANIKADIANSIAGMSS